MARLFLIRRNLEHYLGPMTVVEMKEAYKRMEFGLQDEVAGHCGEWIAFDNIDALRDFYPDLSKVVAEDMLGGWGMSTHSTEKEVNPKKKKKSAASKGASGKHSSLSGFVWGLTLAGVLSVGALGLVYYKPLLSKFLPESGDYSTDQAQALISMNDWSAFDLFMERILPEVIPQLTRSMRSYRDWIPYVRAYAYRHDGEVDGIKAKMLRGLGQVSAPPDCAVSVLREKLANENVTEAWAGRALPKGDAVRLLFADPYWIKRRRDSVGWRMPRSYYEACLMMLSRAWQSESLISLREQNPGVDMRLNTMLTVLRNESPSDSGELPPVPAALQCLDKSTTAAQIDACSFPEGEFAAGWKEQFEFRKRQTQLRVLWSKEGQLNEADRVLLSKASANPAAMDEVTRFDYTLELKFARVILLNSGKIDDAVNKMRLETLDVEFKP